MVDYQEDVNYVPPDSLEPGIYVVPTYTYGVSPFSVAWEIHVTPAFGNHEVTEYAFNPGDGCPVIKGEFTNPAEESVKVAIVPHVYTYIKPALSQYTGRTYYPDVTVKTKSGAIKSLNHNRRKAVEIWVRDGRFDSFI
jgi:hypothetical protein